MENNIQIFKNPAFGEVRVITDEKKKPWFVGKDVAEVLGYSNPRDALRKHVADEDKTTVAICDTGSNYRSQAVFINESGLYSLILSSKLPHAKSFKRWVTSEVLPAIHKDGGYMMANDDETPESIMARAILIADQTIKRLDEANKQLSVKAEHLDNVILCEQCYTTTVIAKDLGMTADALYALLLEKHILFRKSKMYMLYADYATLGLAKNRTAEKVMNDGSVKVFPPRLVWTEKGRVFIHNLIKQAPEKLNHKVAILLSEPSLFS